MSNNVQSLCMSRTLQQCDHSTWKWCSTYKSGSDPQCSPLYTHTDASSCSLDTHLHSGKDLIRIHPALQIKYRDFSKLISVKPASFKDNVRHHHNFQMIPCLGYHYISQYVCKAKVKDILNIGKVLHNKLCACLR